MNEKIIYKWGPLNFTPTPIRGRVVHVGLQNGYIFAWTEEEIDVNVRYYFRTAKLHPTGEQYTGTYHGTVVVPDGMVWHVIEEDAL